MLRNELSSLIYSREFLIDNWDFTESLWNDSASKEFERNYITPIEDQQHRVEDNLQTLIELAHKM